MKSEDLITIDTIECPRNRCDKAAVPKATDMVDKSCPLDDDMQDLYGVRNYGLPSSRPTMISAKYRQKEERRKVLKMSMNKLKRIEDPESSLRRSVLINNTVKRLQREAREEKSLKNQMNSTYSQNKCFGISSDFITKQQEENLKTDVFATALGTKTSDQLLDITNLPDGKTTCSGVSKLEADCLGCDEAADLTFPVERLSPDKSLQQQPQHPTQPPARKRSIDEVLDEECCDVFSQFYLPLTPRTLPLLEDEDEDVNVVDIDTPVPLPPTKRPRDNADSPDTLCCLTDADRLRDNLPCSASASPSPSPSPSPSSTSTSTSKCMASQSLCSSSPSPLASPSTLSLSASTSSMSTFVSSSPLSSMLSQSLSSSSCIPSSLTTQFDEWSIDESILLSNSNLQSTSFTAASPSTSSLTPFSCGHSSILNEIVVYHNLIASFES